MFLRIMSQEPALKPPLVGLFALTSIVCPSANLPWSLCGRAGDPRTQTPASGLDVARPGAPAALQGGWRGSRGWQSEEEAPHRLQAPQHAYSHSISTPPAHLADEKTEAGNDWASEVHGWARSPGGWAQVCLPQVGGVRSPGQRGDKRLETLETER